MSREETEKREIPRACPDCGLSFAGRERGEQEYDEHVVPCAMFTTMIDLVTEKGIVKLGVPDPKKLARHVELYGPEGASAWL